MHYVILRDDDTCALTPAAHLERLYRPFLARGLPVNLAVIPEVRTDARTPDGRRGLSHGGRGAGRPPGTLAESRELADYLLGEPGYHIAQHGCHHDYFEFGSSDSAELARRLDRGAFCLRQAGFARPAAFVAPHDRLSRAAWLEVAGRFGVISTGWFEAGRVPLRWWPRYAWKKLRPTAALAGGRSRPDEPSRLPAFVPSPLWRDGRGGPGGRSRFVVDGARHPLVGVFSGRSAGRVVHRCPA